jgi:hypothetical protein
MAHDGIASRATFNKPGHGHDDRGMVYNYFCPEGRTVSLRNVQGIGWQGVPDQWVSQFGTGFVQRMFYPGLTINATRVSKPVR